jgi:hypothetical protein
MGKGGWGYCTPPPNSSYRGKINGPIRIWEAAQTEFVAKIRIRVHKSKTNSYFDYEFVFSKITGLNNFSPVDVFFWSTVAFGTNSYFGTQYPLLAHVCLGGPPPPRFRPKAGIGKRRTRYPLYCEKIFLRNFFGIFGRRII